VVDRDEFERRIDWLQRCYPRGKYEPEMADYIYEFVRPLTMARFRRMVHEMPGAYERLPSAAQWKRLCFASRDPSPERYRCPTCYGMKHLPFWGIHREDVRHRIFEFAHVCPRCHAGGSTEIIAPDYETAKDALEIDGWYVFDLLGGVEDKLKRLRDAGEVPAGSEDLKREWEGMKWHEES